MKKLSQLLLFFFLCTTINLLAQVTELADVNFKAINIGNHGQGDYTKSVILLHEMYNGTKIGKNYAVGKITAMRGTPGAFNRTNVVNVNTSSAYTNNHGSITSLNTDATWKLITVMYNTKKYMAVHVPYSAAWHHLGFQFEGWTQSTAENMKVIPYEKSGNVLNTEIANSIQDFTPNMIEYHDVSKFVINGEVSISGDIDMTGNNKRLHLGGVGRSTFGISYSKQYPDYGIFYTEGTPDHVSISPNGNATNGVMNVYGDGKVGIGTTNTDGFELAVNGKIRAKEIKVETGWADFVFYDDYKLPTLTEVENHIQAKGHLKDIPSAKEVAENGIFLGDMNAKLLQKIEELTLYTIQQEKKLQKQNSEIELLKKQENKIKKLEEENKVLKSLLERVEKLEKAIK